MAEYRRIQKSEIKRILAAKFVCIYAKKVLKILHVLSGPGIKQYKPTIYVRTVKSTPKGPKFSIKSYLCVEILDAYPILMKTFGLGLLLTFVGSFLCVVSLQASQEIKFRYFSNGRWLGLEYGQLCHSGQPWVHVVRNQRRIDPL